MSKRQTDRRPEIVETYIQSLKNRLSDVERGTVTIKETQQLVGRIRVFLEAIEFIKIRMVDNRYEAHLMGMPEYEFDRHKNRLMVDQLLQGVREGYDKYFATRKFQLDKNSEIYREHALYVLKVRELG